MLDTVERWHVDGLIEIDGRADESWHHFVERLRNGSELGHHLTGLRLSHRASSEFLRNAVLAEPAPNRLTRHRAMALIVHRIRNNLLHGKKLSYGLRGQETNFRHSSHILMIGWRWILCSPPSQARFSPYTIIRGVFKQARIGP